MPSLLFLSPASLAVTRWLHSICLSKISAAHVTRCPAVSSCEQGREAAMRIIVAIGLGLALAANGLLMLLDPAGWYALAPGVPETGPLNLHFVRDIGCAYILTGLALAGLAFN